MVSKKSQVALSVIESYIKDNFRYDPKEGSLSRKDIAGNFYEMFTTPVSGRYHQLNILDGLVYRAHRIAWFLYYGSLIEWSTWLYAPI